MVAVLCGVLLAQPLAYARKSQDEDQESRQKNQHSAPISGGYLEKDNARSSTKVYRDTRRNDPQPQYDAGDEHSNGSSEHNDAAAYRHEDSRDYTPQDNNRSEQRYEPAPRYESAPRYAPRGMNLSEAVSVAERNTGGRVLSAEPLDENGQLSYRVKVLTPNGRVQVLFIDAQ